MNYFAINYVVRSSINERIPLFFPSVKEKIHPAAYTRAAGICTTTAPPPPVGRREGTLLQAERLAIGAGLHSGIQLVSPHQDPVQGAEIGVGAVVGALLHGAFDALVGVMAIHLCLLLLLISSLVCLPPGKTYGLTRCISKADVLSWKKKLKKKY